MILGLGTGTARGGTLLSVPRPGLRELVDATVIIRDLLAGGGDAPILGTPPRQPVPIVWGVGSVRATVRAAELTDGIHLSSLITRLIEAGHDPAASEAWAERL